MDPHTHPVKEREVGVFGLEALGPHPAREDLCRHGRDHVVAPAGVGRTVAAARGENRGDAQGKHGLGGDDHELLVHLVPLAPRPPDGVTLAVPERNIIHLFRDGQRGRAVHHKS